MSDRRSYKPRGNGTYWARVTCKCPQPHLHDFTVSAATDDAWTIGKYLAEALGNYQGADVRLLVWFTKEPYVPRRAGSISADEIEDDVPF